MLPETAPQKADLCFFAYRLPENRWCLVNVLKLTVTERILPLVELRIHHSHHLLAIPSSQRSLVQLKVNLLRVLAPVRPLQLPPKEPQPMRIDRRRPKPKILPGGSLVQLQSPHRRVQASQVASRQNLPTQLCMAAGPREKLQMQSKGT